MPSSVRLSVVSPRLALVATLVVIACLALTNGALANPKYAGLVIDANTGRTLYDENADSPRYPASLTKIMTLYVLFEELAAGRVNFATELDVSKYAAARPPSKIGVRAGGSLKVRDAIKALVTKSANDVATVIAENVSGSEAAFARRMTKTARRLGMTATTFRNPHGLPNSEQRTTARDMARLGLAVQRDFPQYYGVFQTRVFTYGSRRFGNHNRLLGTVRGVDGIKTGYIRASGFNLVTSVRRDGKHIVAVVMGGRTGASRNAHMKTLVERYLPKAKSGKTLPLLAYSDALPPPIPYRKPVEAVLTARLKGSGQTDPIADTLFAFAAEARLPLAGPSSALTAEMTLTAYATPHGSADARGRSSVEGGSEGPERTSSGDRTANVPPGLDAPAAPSSADPDRLAPLALASSSAAASGSPLGFASVQQGSGTATGAIEAAIAVASIAGDGVRGDGSGANSMDGSAKRAGSAGDASEGNGSATGAAGPAVGGDRRDITKGAGRGNPNGASTGRDTTKGASARHGNNKRDIASASNRKGASAKGASRSAAPPSASPPQPTSPPSIAASLQPERFLGAFDAFAAGPTQGAMGSQDRTLDEGALIAAISRTNQAIVRAAQSGGLTIIEMGSAASPGRAAPQRPGPDRPPSGASASLHPEHTALTPASPSSTPAAPPASSAQSAAAHGQASESEARLELVPSWQIQIGAVGSPDEAERLIARAQADEPTLGKRTPVTIPIVTERGTLYRARLGGFPSRAAADAACKRFANHDRPCWAVSM